MRQICMICGILYGIKEPLDDDSETHGICEECFPLELKRIDAELEKLTGTTIAPTKKIMYSGTLNMFPPFKLAGG